MAKTHGLCSVIVRLNDPPATIAADTVETVDKADLADSSSRPDFGRPASKIAVGSNAGTLRNIETVVRWPAARLTADVRIWHDSELQDRTANFRLLV
jgi:hypothetical protein